MLELKSLPFVQARHFTPGRTSPIELIVLHSAECNETETAAEGVANYFHTAAPASAHLTCDDNSVVQSVKFSDTAWHCIGANHNGIGIEHAGRAAQTREQWLDAYGIAMLDLSAQVAAQLCKLYSIPVQLANFASPTNPHVVERGFVGHVSVPGHGSHTDPGSGFPYDYYLGKVQSYLEGLK